MSSTISKITIFDTTMRDGELTPGVEMNIEQKLQLAQLLEQMGVDVIEVGYPGAISKDFEAVLAVSKLIKKSTICGLASSKFQEIVSVAEAIKPAARGRIHVYTPVNLGAGSNLEQTLATIESSVTLARNACADVEWSAFDAPRSNPEFVYQAIERAIKSGASTINIPDSLGLSSPEEFSELVSAIFNKVPNIDRAQISVHCHNDLGLAVENSVAALNCGARQIECSLNGLGARKGNADLGKIAIAIHQSQNYQSDIDLSLLNRALEMVAQMTKGFALKEEGRGSPFSRTSSGACGEGIPPKKEDAGRKHIR